MIIGRLFLNHPLLSYQRDEHCFISRKESKNYSLLQKLSETRGISKCMRNNFYMSGEYIRKNPTLGIEDTSWKLTKIIPMVDEFIRDSSPKKATLLDAGGGAGLILKEVSNHLKRKGVTVTKYALDLSKEMLQRQKENNPDIKAMLNEDISETSISNKGIDLTLMVDVLEHVPDTDKTLKELNRISKYVIFKIPLENNVYYNTLDLIKRGRLRRDLIQQVGHINSYNFKALKKKINTSGGEILCYNFTNVFEYYLSAECQKQMVTGERTLYRIANLISTISPGLCSCLFTDFVVCIVRYR